MGGCLTQPQKRRPKIGEKIQLKHIPYTIVWQNKLTIDQLIIQEEILNLKSRDHPAFAQIIKDIDRTFPGQTFFDFDINKTRFANILKKFALYFPKMGYTQGLNFVGGYLMLQGFEDTSSLKIMIRLASHKDLMFLGLYQDNFPLCYLYCQIFWKMISLKMPDIYHKLKQLNIPDQMWVFQWFLTLFIYSLPLSYIKQIFNFLIEDMEFSLLRVALGIMQCLQNHFRQVTEKFQQEFIECLEYLRDEGFCKNLFSWQQLIRQSKRVKKELILKCLGECKIKNSYKQYFKSSGEIRKAQYRVFLQQKQQDRKNYMCQNESRMSTATHYQRNRDSVQIIDNFQETKIRRFAYVLSQSLRQRPNVGQFNYKIKRYISLRNERVEVV